MAGRSRTNVSAVVYKDFKPQIEQKEEQGANILVIHLPDFPKEQINVAYVDATRSIKVQAEKAVEKNIRSRINQSFPVPQNCSVEKIKGSLRNGVLTITMPRTTVTQHPLDSKEDGNVPKTKAYDSSSTSGVEKQTEQKLKSPPKPIAQTKTPVETAPKPIAEPKPPVATVAKPITEPKPPTAMAPQIPKEKTTGNEFEALPPSKQQEEIQRKVSPIAKQAREEKAGGSIPTTPEIVEKMSETKDKFKDLVKENAKYSMSEAADIPKPTEKGSTIEKKPKEGGGGFLQMKGMNTIMKTVKSLSTDDGEDRQLLINIGVSVLVIVAFGAYITYRYRSSGKVKN